MLSAAVYLTFATLLARRESNLVLRGYLIATALTMVLAVGLSRVYLGVHWPSDVAAGWTIGAGWACLCWVAMRALQREGKVEGESA